VESRANSLRVGLLIVAGIVLILALVWFLRGGQVSHGTLLETYFDESVQGLQVGSDVQFRGVTVGRVTALGVVGAEYGRALTSSEEPLYSEVYVRYLIDVNQIGHFGSIADAVRLGLRARLGTRLITGLSYIELNFLNPATYPAQKLPWTPKAEYIPSAPSAFQQVQNAGQKVLAKLDQVDISKLVESLTAVSQDLQTELESGDLHKTLTAATTLLDSADHAVKGADLPGLSANLRKTSDDLRQLASNPQLAKLLRNGAVATGRLAELTGRMGTLVTSLEATVRQAQAGTTTLQAGLQPILGNLSAASQSLRDLAQSLRQYPGQILSGPPPPSSRPPR
jgi:ABC-type transporter Mla subunit MlaD